MGLPFPFRDLAEFSIEFELGEQLNVRARGFDL